MKVYYETNEVGQIIKVERNGRTKTPIYMATEFKKTRMSNKNRIDTLTFNFETEKQEITNTAYEDISVEILKQELEEEYVPKIEKYKTLGLTVKVGELQAEFLEKYNLLVEA